MKLPQCDTLIYFVDTYIILIYIYNINIYIYIYIWFQFAVLLWSEMVGTHCRCVRWPFEHHPAWHGSFGHSWWLDRTAGHWLSSDHRKVMFARCHTAIWLRDKMYSPIHTLLTHRPIHTPDPYQNAGDPDRSIRLHHRRPIHTRIFDATPYVPWS